MNESSSLSARPTLHLGSPGEFLAAVPYLVGFHPTESLVLVGLDGVRVVVTARLDLDDCGPEDLRHALTLLARAGTESIVVAVYAEPPDASGDPGWSRVIEPLLDQAEWAALRIGEVLIVRGDRFWFYAEADDEAAALALPGTSSRAAATATYAGLVARPDRAALLAVLDRDPDVTAGDLDELLSDFEAQAITALVTGDGDRHGRSVKRAIFAAARAADATLPVTVPVPGRDEQLCRFAVGLGDITVRDAVWLAVDQNRIDGRPLWLELLRRLPEPYDAAPLFLFGWASWRDGNGVLAAEAATRALDSDPSYRAAELLLSAVRNGLDPHRTPRLRNRG